MVERLLEPDSSGDRVAQGLRPLRECLEPFDPIGPDARSAEEVRPHQHPSACGDRRDGPPRQDDRGEERTDRGEGPGPAGTTVGCST
ncbi:hypothetical protein [Nocardioides zeae]